jgi:hypothetical protein
MTPEQQEYYDKELTIIKRGGNCLHDAFVVNCVWGMGSLNLGPVEPAVVGFSNNSDSYYVEYFKNWDEVNAFINQIRKTAIEAWGEQENPTPYMTYPLSNIDVDPVTGDVSFVKRGE